MKKIVDERIVLEENKIFKIVFWIAYIGLFIDFAVKFNLYIWGESAFPYLVVYMGIEGALLIGIFYSVLFLLAIKGILLGSSSLPPEKFYVKRNLLISLLSAAIISLSLWLPRFLFGIWEYGIGLGIAFASIIILLNTALFFGIIYLSLYLAYLVVKKKINAK